MCEQPSCTHTATCVVLRQDATITYACDACADALDDSDEIIEVVDLGAWVVARELDVDPIKVMETHVSLERPPYADVLGHLLRQ